MSIAAVLRQATSERLREDKLERQVVSERLV
jgi:hypothetical protein